MPRSRPLPRRRRASRIEVMHQIALAQWTHDIRNALGTIALYVDTLERPENPQSSRTVASTQALLARVAALCSSAAKQTPRPTAARERFDVTRTIAQVRELIASTLPAPVSLNTDALDRKSVASGNSAEL